MLQSCPSQRNALLEAIGSTDTAVLIAKFDLFDVKLYFPYHVAFQIEVVHGDKTIRKTILDKGASTCVLFVSCWKALGSPELILSNTLLATQWKVFPSTWYLSLF